MLVVILLIIALCVIWLWYGNNSITVTAFSVEGDIPFEFEGFKIAHVSDLHNKTMGKGNKRVLEALKSTDADIIVMTGDMIDSRRTNTSVAIEFAREAAKIAPCYYVTGNHEARVKDEYEVLKEGLLAAGVKVLENENVLLEKGEGSIELVGIHDTGFDFSTGAKYLAEGAVSKEDNYKILLMHRPEYFDEIDCVDLVFSGHAHGGQIRLPFIGGIFAPGQGFFPKYDKGLYKNGAAVMVVSRGIGNSLFPVRVNNTPEIVTVTLKRG